MKALLTLLLVLVLLCGGMVFLSRQDTLQRANAGYKKLAPVTVSFSRFRGGKEHLVSIYWRLHFTGKQAKMPEEIAYWTLKPFRHVTLVTK
jgi:hypothetical protein